MGDKSDISMRGYVKYLLENGESEFIESFINAFYEVYEVIDSEDSSYRVERMEYNELCDNYTITFRHI